MTELADLRARLPAGPLQLTLEMRTRASAWDAYSARDDALLNLGSHLVDLARWLSGVEIARVRAAIEASRAELDLDLADGRGRARVKCATHRPYRELVRVAVDGGRDHARTRPAGLRAPSSTSCRARVSSIRSFAP